MESDKAPAFETAPGRKVTMSEVITCIEDLRVLAKRRVPKMFYDYADTGSWTESTYRANEADFQDIRLRFDVAAPEATPEQLRALCEKTEQYCVVFQTLLHPPKLETTWPGAR